jgi:membrane protease YdiL (CAAX protease family)
LEPGAELPRLGRPVLLALAAFCGILALGEATGYAAEGYPDTGAVWAVFGGALGGVYWAIAAYPARFNRFLEGRRYPRLDRAGPLVAVCVTAATLILIFGIGSVGAAIHDYESTTKNLPATGAPLTQNDVLLQGSLNIPILILPPVLWMRYMRGVRLRDVSASLGLSSERPLEAVVVGLVLAFLGLLFVVALGLGAQTVGHPLPENQQALGISCALSPPSALYIAIVAALTEEIFFRGFLQTYVGVVAQALLFSLAHASYFNAVEFLVTFGLGLAFGWARRATGNLLAPMAGHFAFNAIVFFAAQASPSLCG